MLKNAEASVGMPKRSQALRAPMACAASATSTRKGYMMRVSSTASSNLPGTARNPGASRATSCGLKIMPSAHTAPTTRTSAVATTFESSAASRFPLPVRYWAKTGTKAEEKAPSANRLRVRLGMRKAIWKASFEGPAPKRRAMAISRLRAQRNAAPALKGEEEQDGNPERRKDVRGERAEGLHASHRDRTKTSCNDATGNSWATSPVTPRGKNAAREKPEKSPRANSSVWKVVYPFAPSEAPTTSA